MRRRSGRFARGLLITALAAIVPACGTGGNGTLTPTVAPASPGSPATQSGSGRIVLAWNSSSAAEHYTVKRSSTSGGPYLPLPGATALAGTTYSDTTVVNGTTYYYVVAADNPFGQSADSPETAATPGFFGTLISAGRNSSLARLADGSVWTWGSNQSFELGDGTGRASSPVAVPVVNLPKVTAVSSHWDHYLAVLADGSVWAWGSNGFGILGDGSPDLRKNVPVQALGITGAVDVAAGFNHSMALTSDGRVWTWGKAMGPGGTNTTLPAQLPSLSGIVKIATCQDACYALRDDGTVWAWGANGSGQLGIGTTGGSLFVPTQVVNLTGITDIVAGSFHAGAIRSDGTVWMWGDNSGGQLGNGSTTSSPVPTPLLGLGDVVSLAANFAFTLALLGNGSVLGWGSNTTGQLGSAGGSVPLPLADLIDIRAIAAGVTHSLAIGADGHIWCWGNNSLGQLGSGTGASQVLPVQVANLTNVTTLAGGANHGLALRSDSSVWGWGANNHGQLIAPPAGLSSALYRTQITNLPAPAVSAVAASRTPGGGFSVARRSNGTLLAWGANGNGELGTGSPGPPGGPVVQVSNLPGTTPDTTVVSVSCGTSHTLAQSASGRLWTWGSNAQGQIGNNSAAANVPAPVQILANVTAIGAGLTHGLAVVGSGPASTVWAWGSNGSAELGYAGALSRVPLQVAGLTGVSAVAAGEAFSLALRTDGTVWAWGINSSGQLGDGSVPTGLGPPRPAPAPVVNLTGVIAIAAGQYHGVALRSDGSVWTWGANSSGQLGDGTANPAGTPVPTAGLAGIAQISAGTLTSLALGSDGNAWVWGFNGSGQVGNGSAGSSSVPILLTR